MPKEGAANGDRPDGGREVMIDVDHLTRYYGEMPALKDVTFRAYRGEIVGFLGPNGAGKTTTMRILTGYMPPTSGQAFVAGHDVVEDSMAARREIGYLPENTPLYSEMTIRGYLDFMARLRGVRHPDEAVERAMSRVSIDHRADDLIGQLSKGYRQRVGIAQAIVHDPKVIILDEPTIGLDPRQVREVRALIRELGGDHTVMISTHILTEAQQICDRVLIINRGELVAEDTPENLTAKLSGGQQVRLVVGDAAKAGAVTSALKAVRGVDEVEDAGGGVYLVQSNQEAGVRPALAKAVVENGWPLMELTPVALTLEDIYLQLTADSGGDEGMWVDEDAPDETDDGAEAEVAN